MDSLTMEMERDKRELEPVQEQGAGLTNTQQKVALHSEVDLADHEESVDDFEDEHKHVDYTNFTKAQFVGLIKELVKETNHQKVESVIREIKPLFDEIKDKEKELRDFRNQKFGYEGELFKKRQELIKPIQDKVYIAIQKLAIERSYDFILDKSEGITVIFADPKLDRSDEVLKFLGVK
jgi:Skp family chaperone for outer membrane proteins